MPHAATAAGTVIAATLTSACKSMRGLGVDVGEALRCAGIDEATLAAPDARVSAAAAVELWASAVRLSGDPDLGLHVAERIEPGTLDALDFAMRAAPTCLDALQRLCRYHRIVSTGVAVELELGPDGATLRHGLASLVPVPRALRDVMVASLVIGGRQTTGCAWRPLEVRFAYPEPERVGEHLRILGGNVRFGCSFDELILPTNVLELPQRGADEHLARVLDRYLDDVLGRLPASASFGERVRRAVAVALADGAPSADRTACALGVSRRTLARRLEGEGTSFSAVVDELRAEMAVTLLAERGLGVAEVGYLLGFSEPSAFSRAFQRWNGVSPSEYRARLDAPRRRLPPE